MLMDHVANLNLSKPYENIKMQLILPNLNIMEPKLLFCRHGALVSTFSGSADPYERWWFHRDEEKGKENETKPTEKLPSSWNFAQDSAEFFNEDPKGGKRALLVRQPSEIDAWRCGK